MRRFAIVTVLALLLMSGYATAAHAAAESRVWVDSGVLYYEYSPGAQPAHLVIRNSGDTFTVDDAWGIYAGAGCSYPTEDGSLVACLGASFYRVVTGPGNDFVDVQLTGGHAADLGRVDLGAGDDIVYGGDGGEVLQGQAGDDIIIGRGADDGANIIYGGPGADYTYGGSGLDIVYYTDSPSGVVADPDWSIGDDGAPGEGDTIGGDVEGIYGSPFDDVITGNAADNTLEGCGGRDRIDGLGGDDRLDGDGPTCTPGGVVPADPDVILGGSGIDTVRYDSRTEPILVDLTSTAATDGQSGEHDQVGPDVENVQAGRGNDVVVGSAAANHISGGYGDDLLLGLAGDDWLEGSLGDDSLYGGDGADTLDGGVGGRDLCNLGPGGSTRIACER